MKPGPKPTPPSHKDARGTYRSCRDSSLLELFGSGDPPEMPDYLTPAARIVWHQEIGRVMGGGCSELDSALFARYCSIEALARQSLAAGELVASSVVGELRRVGELFGIAGPKSRTFRRAGSRTNSFAGRRQKLGHPDGWGDG